MTMPSSTKRARSTLRSHSGLNRGYMSSGPQDFKGLTLNDGAESAEGVAAHKLALQIASHLGVNVPDMFGIGSQLRIACAKILEHLGSKEKVAA